MEAGGLIWREERRIDKTGSKTNVYHLEGLIKAATLFALEVLEERALAAAAKKAKAAKKGKPKLKLVKDDE